MFRDRSATHYCSSWWSVLFYLLIIFIIFIICRNVRKKILFLAPTIPGEEEGERLPEPARKITPGPIPGPETTIRKPSEKSTTPVPPNLCALPLEPAPDPTADFSHGYRFGLFFYFYFNVAVAACTKYSN